MKELPVAQAGGELVATENGDTNGDGGRDIGDAIYLVRWLFRGGPGPVALETDDAAVAETQAALASCSEDLAVVEATLAERDADRDELLAALAAAEARIAELEVTGCSDPEADNYDCTVNVDDGSCEYSGCTDPEALNFAPDANVDDGSCCYSEGECLDLDGFTYLHQNDQGYYEFTHDETGIVFVYLPGGDFEMGSPDTEPNRSSNEGPVHTVTLSPFLIAKRECTQAEYAAVMDSNPSSFTGDVLRPVEQVSWDDLHEADGFLARTGLSLPTEAQWEYAARAGTRTAFSFGDECNAATCDPCATADGYMLWCGNAGGTTHPVGEKLPNPFGLHDMHGNVWEWCEDVYDEDFYESEAAAGLDPVADSGSGFRVGRGGSWNYAAWGCRSAFRRGNPTADRNNYGGFRPLRPLP